LEINEGFPLFRVEEMKDNFQDKRKMPDSSDRLKMLVRIGLKMNLQLKRNITGISSGPTLVVRDRL